VFDTYLSVFKDVVAKARAGSWISGVIEFTCPQHHGSNRFDPVAKIDIKQQKTDL
jgi:hypothetical protein